MKRKIRYFFKENWTIKILGIDFLENKNLKLNFWTVLYAVSVFFCYFLSFYSISDLHTLDFYKILASKINFDYVVLSYTWGLISYVPYKLL